MPFKPLEVSEFERFVKIAGWKLIKGKIDHKLYDENDQFLCTIKIAHSKKGKTEVVAHSVKKTEKEFKLRGWSWPPQKKSKLT